MPSSNSTHATTEPGRGRPPVAEILERTLHHDRLWAIEDVAMFLGFSVRLTEEIVRDPRFPQPRLVTKGGVRRWSPARWHAWVDAADATWLGEVIDGAPAGSDDTEMAVI